MEELNEHLYISYLYSTKVIWLATLIVHNGYIVVANVTFSIVEIWVRLFCWYQSSNMEDNLKNENIEIQYYNPAFEDDLVITVVHIKGS